MTTYNKSTLLTAVRFFALTRDKEGTPTALTELPAMVSVWSGTATAESHKVNDDYSVTDKSETRDALMTEGVSRTAAIKWTTGPRSVASGYVVPDLIARSANLFRYAVGRDGKSLIWSDYRPLPTLSPREADRDPQNLTFRGRTLSALPDGLSIELPPYVGGATGIERDGAIMTPHVSFVGKHPTLSVGLVTPALDDESLAIASDPILAMFAGLVTDEAEAEADKSAKVTASEAETTATI